MDLLAPELRERLLANGRNRQGTHVPVVRWFNPAGPGTWLVSELDPEDPDVAHCLADLGMRCPEIGSVRVSELEAFQGPFGLAIERDLWFDARSIPLATYAEAARAAGRIVESGPEIDAAAEPSRAGSAAGA